MRSRSRRAERIVPACALMAGVVLGIGIGVAGAPLWRLALIEANRDAFGRLTYLCDTAMRSHMIAGQAVAYDPSEATVRDLKAAEIALLDCQDYDLMRKRLIRWGLRDNELSEMSLHAIEERADGLQPVVQTHEIRY